MKKTALLLAAGVSSMLTARAADILWVSFHPGDSTPSANAAAAGFTRAPDAGYTDLLTAAGHNVTRVVSTGTPDPLVLNAADLVIISRSVPSGDYETDAETAAWNGITAPTMILSGYVLRNNRLGFTSGADIPDTVGTVTLDIADSSHPIFAGIALDAEGNMATPFATAVSYNGTLQRGISVNTSPVAGGGTVLATVGGTTDPAAGGMVIAEWAAGSVLGNSPPDTLGGHRMVFLTGSREADGLTSEGAGIYNLTADGAQLFLNAVEYMAVPEPSPVALLTLGFGAALLARSRKKA
jgi:hypothetical protein